ncbi:cytochrome c biogenesis protein CcsA [Algiphilus sp.]|uniref:cytochrome C assembly family protein n=1 Tax=Algiphilus sp. TaxID=1872431 RepID=UPI0025C42399|nr:cytochrome c biogenesis protein CcsA [Algiphilus sp.]MCK5771863.1 cytochrome c biogenesis protein CcsA [Algiphilus sp.]
MIFAGLCVVAYGVAAFAAHRARRALLFGAGSAAVLLHAVALLGDVFHDGVLHIGLLEAVSLVLWQASLLLLLSWRFMPVVLLAMITFPLSGAMAIIAAWPTATQTGASVEGWPLQLHVGLSVFAAGLFTLAALQSILLAFQSRYLHSGADPGGLRNLPPLQSMESALFGALWLAWGMLSASLLTGILFVDDLLAQHLVHKTVLSVVSWAVFLMLLWGHWRYGWRGRTALRWTWTGYAVLLTAYFGSKFVLEALLGQHWG